MIMGFVIYCLADMSQCNVVRHQTGFDTVIECQREALTFKEQLEQRGLVFVGEVCFIPGETL